MTTHKGTTNHVPDLVCSSSSTSSIGTTTSNTSGEVLLNVQDLLSSFDTRLTFLSKSVMQKIDELGKNVDQLETTLQSLQEEPVRQAAARPTPTLTNTSSSGETPTSTSPSVTRTKSPKRRLLSMATSSVSNPCEV